MVLSIVGDDSRCVELEHDFSAAGTGFLVSEFGGYLGDNI